MRKAIYSQLSNIFGYILMKKTFLYFITTSLFACSSVYATEDLLEGIGTHENSGSTSVKVVNYDPSVLELSTLQSLNARAKKGDGEAIEAILGPIANGLSYNRAQWSKLFLIDWPNKTIEELLTSNSSFQQLFLASFFKIPPLQGVLLYRLESLKENIQKRVKEGDAEALNIFGLMHEEGLGVTKDLNKALQCFSDSAALNNCHGLYNFARLHNNYSGLDANLEVAAINYDKAQKLGHRRSKTELAKLWSKVRMSLSFPESMGLLKEAASGGDDDAQALLALYFRKGLCLETESSFDVKAHYEKALTYINQALKQGYLDSARLKEEILGLLKS